MNTPQQVELRQALLEILRGGVAANQDEEVASVSAKCAPGAPGAESPTSAPLAGPWQEGKE